ncbi:MAG: hypothetical protein AAFO29_17580, partial [Actinomycetota bacterium]
MANVVPLRAQGTDGPTFSSAIEGFFAAVDLAGETQVVYLATLTKLEQDLPANTTLVDVDRQAVTKHLRSRYGDRAPATYNRNLATISSLFTWCVEND